jgi:mannose-6-phosphate isomerase-like protein (cupin superfamily)
MDFKHVLDLSHFAPDKMQKINLFETKNFFCDIYCLEPGQEQKAHSHQEEDKVYFVLDGRGSFIVGEEIEELGTNQAVFAPAGKLHGVKNTSDSRLMLLVFMTPNPNYR